MVWRPPLNKLAETCVSMAFKGVDCEVDGLGKLSDDFLRQASHRESEVVNVHFGDNDVGPAGLQSMDEVKQDDPEL